MPFIPANQMVLGTRVRTKRDIKVLAGTFTAGTEMTIVGDSGCRGWNLKDDEGNELTEVGVIGGSMSELFEVIS